MSSVALFQPVTIGDQRPIAVDVTPSDNATIVSATFAIVRRITDAPGSVWQSGTAVVDVIGCGFRLTTPSLITFPVADLYTCQFSIVWSDGQVDNSVSAVIQALPLRR
jgi:hypothetical protein